jgi:hypothetical protein
VWLLQLIQAHALHLDELIVAFDTVEWISNVAKVVEHGGLVQPGKKRAVRPAHVELVLFESQIESGLD